MAQVDGNVPPSKSGVGPQNAVVCGLFSASRIANGQAGRFHGFIFVDGGVTAYGNLSVTGIKAGVVPHPDGTHRRLCSLQNPESWFEDFGRAELIDGRAEVALDADFAALVDTDDYHVFLTPEGESGGLHVRARTSGSFEVREQADGRSKSGFSYRIVARRRDVDHERLAVVEIPPTPELQAPGPELLEEEATD